jgi:hypothetical protein
MRAIVRNVRNELKNESKIERNVVVSGLPDDEIVGDETNRHVEKAVESLLTVMDIDKAKVARCRRLRRKVVNTAAKNTEPPPVLIEFVDRETQELAIKSARKLKSIANFEKVYVNRDKTEDVRKEEAELRRERNTRNQALPHSDGALRYGVDEKTNKRYYWGVRGGRLVQVEPRTPAVGGDEH